MRCAKFEQLLSAIQRAHNYPDPLLSDELALRFDALSSELAGLPADIRPLVEALTWDILPGDWAFWLELSRRQGPLLH